VVTKRTTPPKIKGKAVKKTAVKKTAVVKQVAKKKAPHQLLVRQAARKAAIGRVSKDQAKAIILDAAIELLRDQPVSQVSSREIAAETGLNHSYITRYFGSGHEMLFAVTEELRSRLLRYVEAGEIREFIRDPDAHLRVRIMQFLLSEGFDPKRFAAIAKAQLAVTEKRFKASLGLEKRAARAYRAKLALLLLVADADLGVAVGFDNATKDDLITLTLAELDESKAMAKKLGWQ